MTASTHRRCGPISHREHIELVRMLREYPIAKVRAWTVARNKPRAYETLARLAALDDAK